MPLLATGGILQQDAGSEVLRLKLGGPGHKVLAAAEGAEPAKQEAEATVTLWPPTRTGSRRRPREGRHSAGDPHSLSSRTLTSQTAHSRTGLQGVGNIFLKTTNSRLL